MVNLSDSDLKHVQTMVRAAVHRKKHLFLPFPDLYGDIEGLKADILGDVLAAWHKYDAAKSRPGTFAYGVASCRLLDLWKSRTRELKRIHGYARRGDGRADDDPAQQVATMMETARQRFSRYGVPLRLGRQKRHSIDRAQAAAVLWLRNRYQLSVRGVAVMLAEDSELRRAMGLDYTPSHMSIQRALRAVTIINFSRKKPAA